MKILTTVLVLTASGFLCWRLATPVQEPSRSPELLVGRMVPGSTTPVFQPQAVKAETVPAAGPAMTAPRSFPNAANQLSVSSATDGTQPPDPAKTHNFPARLASGKIRPGPYRPSSSSFSRPFPEGRITEPPSGFLSDIIVPFSITDSGETETLPAALASPENLTAEEQAAFTGLGETFVTEVSRIPAAPSDPAYQELWRQAQEENDAAFKARYGGHAWLKQHTDSRHQAHSQTASP